MSAVRPRALRPRRQIGIVVLTVVFLLAGCGGNKVRLTGTELDGRPSPDFSLTGFRGEQVELSNLRGRAVVLTFIYTNCPDVCPLTAENLRYTETLLDERTRERVEFVAITIDPDRDTADALFRFADRHQLATNPRFHAVTGDRSSLEAVWQAYGIDPGASALLSHSTALSGTPGAAATHQAEAAASLFLHTDAIFVIDPDGRQRVFLRSDFDPTLLAKDLKSLT